MTSAPCRIGFRSDSDFGNWHCKAPPSQSVQRQIQDNERQNNHTDRPKADHTIDHFMHGSQEGNTRGRVFELPTWRYFPSIHMQKPFRMKDSGQDQARANCIFRQFNHIVQLKLPHQVAAVHIDRARRYVQLLRDARRRLAFGQQGRHLQFAPR